MEKLEDLKDKIDSLFVFDSNKELGIGESSSLTLEQQISALQSLKNEIVTIDRKEIKTLEDKEFIQTNIKTLCEISLEAVKNWSQNIRIGSPANYGESLAMLITATTNLFKELREFGKTIHDLEMIHDPEILVSQKNESKNSLVFDAKSLAEFVNDVRKSSELNSIVAEFKIEDGEFTEIKSPKISASF